jgi:hypothetical protein
MADDLLITNLWDRTIKTKVSSSEDPAKQVDVTVGPKSFFGVSTALISGTLPWNVKLADEGGGDHRAGGNTTVSKLPAIVCYGQIPNLTAIVYSS